LWYTEDVEWLAQARRGVIELCVLALIASTPRYGYELTSALAKLGKPLETPEGTLYPLLRRLQREGLVEADWQESPDGPPRKYYSLTAQGRGVLQQQREEWDALTQAIDRLRHEEVSDGTRSERHPPLSRRTAEQADTPSAS
jgi:PadR family transcriptional regulator, regulatory protein PadR